MKLFWTLLAGFFLVQQTQASIHYSPAPIATPGRASHLSDPVILKRPQVARPVVSAPKSFPVSRPFVPTPRFPPMSGPMVLAPRFPPRLLPTYSTVVPASRPPMFRRTPLPRLPGSFRTVRKPRLPVQKKLRLIGTSPRFDLYRPLPSFDSVSIQGNVDLQIKDQRKSGITYQREYPDLKVNVSGRGLYIINPPSSTSTLRPAMTLNLGQLRRLTVSGNCRIIGHNLNNDCGLCIVHCGSGSVCLTGQMNVTAIENIGCACISIQNVTSQELHILATRKARVELSGCTGLLLIRAFDHACVDTRCLRSMNAMIQAADETLVTVSTMGDLQAFASGISNIYYYITPRNLSDHTMFSGNVLPMGCCE